jgi:NADH dehydrogenase FAD-containing subunit
MHVVNDNNCGWINDLNPRTNIKSLSTNENCDWLIIGAGYTGLSAARKLSQLHPRHRIIITDSQLEVRVPVVEIQAILLTPR